MNIKQVSVAGLTNHTFSDNKPKIMTFKLHSETLMEQIKKAKKEFDKKTQNLYHQPVILGVQQGIKK